MQFQPKSEKEVSRIFEKGEYAFVVIDSVEKLSKKGKPMIELNLEISHSTIIGKKNRVRCFLMTSEPNFEFLIRHFCYSVGIGDQYESGNLNASTLVGKRGVVLIGIEKSDGYPDKNKVLDFLEKQLSTHVLQNQSYNQDMNDDINF